MEDASPADRVNTSMADQSSHSGVRNGKTRLLSLDDLDRRTRAFQVAHDTKHAIISDLGGADSFDA